MIKPIVEGHGEVAALPVLLRRIAGECFQIWDPPLLKPGRYPSGRLVRRSQGGWLPGEDLAKAGGHAKNEKATAILLLVDLDDGCAKEAALALSGALAEATGLKPSAVVFAVREYEAWLLASSEHLAEGVLPFPGDPEKVRDAKGALEDHLQLPFPYDERTDQPRYSAQIDLGCAYHRCRSFRKLVKDFRSLLYALGFEPAEWSP